MSLQRNIYNEYHYMYNLHLNDFSGENTDSAKSEICKLDSDKGTCDDNNQRWYYNEARSTCELFNWGGCAGNRLFLEIH